ncbi:kelch-like protein [Archangium minus]|uniref:Kelch-like protein n=2 Tax=Archangium minus TaxID=83450 RepID=A0ABY9XA80_9BACT|nr:kelch-like protein [Archangium minus]
MLAVLAGCEPSSPPAGSSATGTMRLAIATPAAAPGDVARVTVTVSGADMSPLSSELVLTDGVWGGVLGDIPAGPHRTFLARAFNTSNALRYEGRAEDVTVTAGTTGLLSLSLTDVSVPPPFTNETPLIDSLTVNPTSVLPGGTVSLSASAHDPNAGDSVSYTWTAPSGSFSTPTQANTRWTAPMTQGVVGLSLTVRDSRGAAVSMSLPIQVRGTGVSSWSSTGSMASPRYGHQATLLPTGKVLVSGGHNGSTYLATAEVYDPATGTWTSTAPMASPRNRPTATLLPSGKVLVAGGTSSDTTYLATAEVYDPATGTWSPTGAMKAARTLHTATPLPDGKVLVLGGLNSSTYVATAEVYDPATGTWNSTGPMASPHFSATATPLPDGKVLVSGGVDSSGAYLATAEVYDPVTGTWSPTRPMDTPRGFHLSMPLSNGKVLVSAGSGKGSYVTTSTLYDSATGTWQFTGYTYTERRAPTATLLPDGKVLALGGYTTSAVNEAEVYDPATGSWSLDSYMRLPREWHTATLLPSGIVLITGGTNYSGALSSAELYFPAMGR